MSAPAKLLDLLRAGELDWDNQKHREAFLKAWANGDLPVLPLPEESAELPQFQGREPR